MGVVVSISDHLKKAETQNENIDEESDYWTSIDEIVIAREKKIASDRKKHNRKVCHDLKLKSSKQ